MAASVHFGWLKITFHRISLHFRSIHKFYFILDYRKSLLSPFQINTQLLFIFSQNGCRQAFWMIENHFRSHFSPFQINTQIHFGWPKITFLTISYQYATFIYFSQNGCRRPFRMTENHFWSHFSPFQINMQLFF